MTHFALAPIAALVLAVFPAPSAFVAQDTAPAVSAQAPAERNANAKADDTPDALRRSSFNLDESGVALGGYDPVSYFDKAGPREGKAAFSFVYRGVTYRFVSEENKKKFESDPVKWEPPYGGWCAWAVIDGDKVAIDPLNYEIIDGRVYLFYKGWLGNAKKKWDAKVTAETAPKTVAQADSGWKKVAKSDRDAYDAEQKKKTGK
jgi:YHS domain-containing protein